MDLNETFVVTYTIYTDRNRGNFTRVVIEDDLLNRANGFEYENVTITTTSHPEPFSPYVIFKQQGIFEIRNNQTKTFISSGEVIYIKVPIRATDIKAQYYLNSELNMMLNYQEVQEVKGETLNQMNLVSGQFYIQLWTNFDKDYAYSDDQIGYTFKLCNLGNTPIYIEKGQLVEKLPGYTKFVGWGLSGEESPPRGYEYIEGIGITNSEDLVIMPYSAHKNQVSFNVQVE